MSSRPTNFKVGNAIPWSIRVYTEAGLLVDADSNPVVTVRRDGVPSADVVTVTKRAATTGIYDCSYNPSSDFEGEMFEITETAMVSTEEFENAWSMECQAAERGTDGASSQSSVDSVDADLQAVGSDVSTVLGDTNELQQNQNQWLTATGFATPSDLSGLATESTAGQLEQNQQGLLAILTGTIIPNQSAISSRVVSIEQVTDKVDTMIQVNGADWQYTADSLALAPTGSGGGGGDTAADIYAYFTSNGREDAFIAVGFATPSDVSNSTDAIEVRLNAVDSSLTGIESDLNQVEVDLGSVQASTGSILSGVNSLLAVNYATAGDVSDSENVVVAKIDSLNDFNPSLDTVAHVTLVDTTTNLTNQSAGGEGMYQASVRVQNTAGESLQGARLNIDGTTLSLTTGVDGEVIFNLDSGVYLINLLPPAGYNTPVGEALVIGSSDPNQTVFTLTQTSPPAGCTPPWLG